MKTTVILIAASLLLIPVSVTRAQNQSVSLELALDQEQFLPHEKLVLRVRITNFSGQNISMGKHDDWLMLNVESKDRFIVRRLGPPPVKGEFLLESSTTATKRVDLAPYFDLTKPGSYSVTATVRIPEWGLVLQSRPVSFQIVSGSELWEQEFGVPSRDPKGGSAPEFRKYTLLQTAYKNQLSLYLRLSDPSEREVHKLILIGPVVSFSRPEPQLDQFSNLHLLYQIGAKSFLYHLISPDGLIITRETYDQTTSRPRLKPQPDGRIIVAGGTRRRTPSDIPPPVSALPQQPVSARQ